MRATMVATHRMTRANSPDKAHSPLGAEAKKKSSRSRRDTAPQQCQYPGRSLSTLSLPQLLSALWEAPCPPELSAEALLRVSRERALLPQTARNHGLSEAQVLRVWVALEISHRRDLARSELESQTVMSPETVFAWARPRLSSLLHEEVWVLSVDSRSRFLAAHAIARGGAHACGLLPRDALAPPLLHGASGFILVHNHPSGDPTPSAEDIRLTQALGRAGESLGLPLLDHVVAGGAAFISFRQQGLL